MSTTFRPIVTEKSTMLAEKGKYQLAVSPTTTKIEVKQYFKKLYGVDVESVNVLKVQPKVKLGKNRAQLSKRRAYKKVIVTTKGRAQVDLSKLKA